MAIAWTEAWSSFTAAGTGWQNYDLYTNKSVPKGAIAYILIANATTTAKRTVGVRTDGSSLNRYVDVARASTTSANNCIGMYVKCDASTGLIETYVDTNSTVTFYLCGYWTGVDFTELMGEFTDTGTAGWVDVDLSSLGVPDSRVVQCALMNTNTGAAEYMGVRPQGSSVDSYIVCCQPTTDGWRGYTTCVKANASGVISHRRGPNKKEYCLGYFDSQMDHVQSFINTTSWSNSAGSWAVGDISSNIGNNDGTVIDASFGYNRTSSSGIYGVRMNGSSLVRSLTLAAATSGAVNMVGIPTKTDANGAIQCYAASLSYDQGGLFGYYLWTAVTTHEFTEDIGITEDYPDPEKSGGTVLKEFVESIGISESYPDPEKTGATVTKTYTDTIEVCDGLEVFITGGGGNFYKTYTDGVDLADAFGKNMNLPDPLAVADALTSKNMKLPHAMGVADKIAQKSMAVPHAMSVADKLAQKSMLMPSTVGVADKIAQKQMLVPQPVGLADSIGRKQMTMPHAMSVVDKLAQKSMAVPQTVTVSEGPKVNKNQVLFTQPIGLADKFGKTMMLPQSIDVSDSHKMPQWVMHLAEAVGLEDSATAQRTGAVKEFVESIAITEAFGRNKRLPYSDEIEVENEQVRMLQWVTHFADTVASADALLRSKTIPYTQLVDMADSFKMPSWVAHFTDSMHAADGVVRNKTLPYAQPVGLTDALRFTSWVAHYVDAVSTAEVLRRNKTIPYAQPMGVSDVLRFGSWYAHYVDGVDLADSATATRTSAIKQFAETVSVADKLAQKTMRLSQTVGVSDTATKVLYKVFAEAVALCDGLEVFISGGTLAVVFSDAVSISDAAVRNKTLAYSQPVALADSGLVGKTLLYAQAVSATDRFGKTMKLAQSVAVSDAMRFTSWYAHYTDSAAVADAKLVSKTLPFAQPVSVADQQLMKQWVPKFADTIATADQAYKLMSEAVRLYIDSVGVSDTIASKNMRMPQTVSVAELAGKTMRVPQAIAVTEARAVNKSLAYAQSIGVSDALVRNKTLPYAQAVGVSDKLASKTMKLVATIAVSDSAVKVLFKTFADAVAVCDGLEVFISGGMLTWVFSEAIGVTDLFGKSMTMPAGISVTDELTSKTMTLPAGVAVNETLARNKSLPFAQPMSVADRFGKTMKLPQAVQLNDAIGRKQMLLPHAMSVADALLRSKTTPLLDAVEVDDSIVRNKSLPYAQPVSVTDAHKMPQWYVKSAQGIGVTDQVGRDKRLPLSQAVGVADSLRFPQWYAHASDAVGVADAALSNKTLPFSQAISVADLQRMPRWFIKLAESVSVAEEVLAQRVGAVKEFVETIGVADVIRQKQMMVPSTIAVSDALRFTRWFAHYTDTAAVSERINKTMKIPAAMAVTDAYKMPSWYAHYADASSMTDRFGKTMLVPTAIGLSDAQKANKSLPYAQPMSVADKLVQKSMTVPIAVGVSDKLASKTMRVSQAVSVVDATVRNKTLAFAQGIALGERLGKTMRIPQVIGLSDTVAGLTKQVITQVWEFFESIGVSDGALLNKTFVLTDAVAAVEALVTGLKVVQVVEGAGNATGSSGIGRAGHDGAVGVIDHNAASVSTATDGKLGNKFVHRRGGAI